MGPALRGAAVIQGGQGRPPLQSKTGTVRSGTSGTPSPTHSVIARSEATRQSVLPCPKRRIPAPVTQGGQRHPPLQSRTRTARSGTAGTPSPTHSVIARSEATRQSVLPSPKRRIPAPVTRLLARNDSAPRWERRDTWVPPYGVRRSSRANRVVRPYKAKQEPSKTRTACPTNRRGAARTAKIRNFFFPLSASAGLRRLYSDDTGRPPVL